jgi:hypothetical protein
MDRSDWEQLQDDIGDRMADADALRGIGIDRTAYVRLRSGFADDLMCNLSEVHRNISVLCTSPTADVEATLRLVDRIGAHLSDELTRRAS